MDYKLRLRRIQENLAAHKLDALLITHLPNITYLCGFTGSAGALIVNEGGAEFFSDGRYTAQARDQVQAAHVIISPKPPLAAAAEWLAERRRNKRVLGVEGEHISWAGKTQLEAALRKTTRLKSVSNLVEDRRMIKDADELCRIRNAVTLGATLFDTILAELRVDARERQVAAEMEYAARRLGAEGMSFETIIASGPRSALPHGRASDSRVPRNAFVVCDFGVILAGYCSDMTRTVYVGRPSREARRFYEAVREAQLAGIAAVRPGIAVGEVDRVARNVLKKAGLGRYFTHSTGHGVGLEIHEPPRVAAGQLSLLQPGMVITIEPGAYVPGKWGVRIEDMVVVTHSGCEVLTPTSKELIAV